MTSYQGLTPNKDSSDSRWNEIPLRIDHRDRVQTLDVLETPHTLLTGHSGSEKRITHRDVFAHVSQHSDMWNFYGFDSTGVEMTPYIDVPGVKQIATNLEEAVEMLSKIKKKAQSGKKKKRSLLVIDEISFILTSSSYPSERFLEEARENDLKEKAAEILTWILSEGSIFGIHVVLGTKESDVNVIQGALRNATGAFVRRTPNAPVTWNEIPLGVNRKGENVTVDVQVEPGFLIAGKAGSGKSMLLNHLFTHVKEHPEDWRFIGIDPNRYGSDFPRYEGETVTTYVAKNIKDSYRALDYVHREMNMRYTLMDLSGVTNFKELHDTPKALLVAVEEMNFLFSPENGAPAADREKAAAMLRDIARLGRAAGIFLALSVQDPNEHTTPLELKQNLHVRVAMGKMDANTLDTVLGLHEGVSLSAKTGHAVVSVFGAKNEIQLFGS